MAVQNLVSASLTAEAKAEIQKDLADIKKQLSFLSSISKADVATLMKVGNGFAPLLDKAYATFSEHPEIMPLVFPSEEFRRDYQLYKDLGPIAGQISQLAESVDRTMTALASDTMMESLEVYQAVKQSKNKVPGLEAVADEMGSFFARSRHKAKEAKG